MNGEGSQVRIYQKDRPQAALRYLGRQQVAPDVRLPSQIRATGMKKFITPPKITKMKTPQMGSPNMAAPINPPMRVPIGAPMNRHPHYQ